MYFLLALALALIHMLPEESLLHWQSDNMFQTVSWLFPILSDYPTLFTYVCFKFLLLFFLHKSLKGRG